MEKAIARQCAPALAGIKPANIVSLDKNKYPDAENEIVKLNEAFNKIGVYFEIICRCENRILVFVFRPKILESYLENEGIRSFLSSCGYNEDGALCEKLEKLKSKMKNAEFPHEIGAFLGYPVEDIYGFINHKDKGLLFVGEWKVYSNPEKAKQSFKRYSSCRAALVRRVSDGKALAEIFKAA
ncbi:MAG: DUF3793 family protein [Clostridia bacterium]|nr:DUF3793 family protein [Clostridia bacterium]